MFLDEIFRPKTGDEVLMSAEDMRQARINRYGTDDITPVTALDYSDKFNTELTPDEEAEFQAWAKENNRERDSYDYDIRGAWKELKSGSMSEDERGHLGDKYKKPNHPTFSDQSVYNGKDGVAGGTWSEVDGKTVFTPGRMLSKREAEHLSDYFKRVEPDVKLNLDGKIIKPKPLPGTGYEPSWFEGIGDSWQGMNAALAETKSSALTVLSELPIGTEEEREGWLRAAEATRAYSKAHYEADPEIMGSATQIIHGLFRSIPKAAGYSAALGPGAGALAFGADIGVNESQKLKDDGVDQNTRTWAGVTSFAANAIGLRLPAAIGGTRLQSTLYGGLANIGTDSAERKGIQFILEQQDYKELARQYDLNSTDMIVSGAFGAFFGAAAWRRPLTKLERDTQERRDALRRDLKATGVYTDEQADVQSGAHAKGEVLFARDAGVDWKDVAYTIEKGDERSAANAFHMPVTQGIEWHAGPTKLSADTALELKVIENTQKPLEQVVPSFQRTFTEGVTNKDTGFKLTASVSDIKKWTAKARRRWFLQTVGDDLVELAEGARLIESHSDVVHGNPEVQGVHKLVNAVRIGDQNLRVVFTVRDYATKGQERTALHSVDNIDFELVETTNPPVNEASATSGSFDGDTVPAPEVAQHPVGPHPFKVTLSQVLGGNKPYVRADGKSYFDPVDLGATVVGGVYYDAPSSRGAFEQAAYHGTAYTFDKFTLDHVGSGEGVQAHGWGLYFSLDRQIAEGYRSRVTSYRSVADELSRVFAGMDVKTREGMAKALYSAGDKLSPATRELLDALQEANWLGHENPMDAVQASLVAQIGKGKQTPRIESAVEGLRNEDGNVYKVEIPDDDVMMHEDLPLSQQPEAVQNAVRALLTDEDVRTQPAMRREKNGIEDVEPVSYAGKSLDEMTGKEILAALIAKYGSAKAASLALKQHGLKGYRYKGAIDGECAVVFDDAAIEMRNAIEKAVEDGSGVVHMPDGTFEVRGMYEPAARKITLTPKADISTFAHEHAHWYLDMLMRVLDNGKIKPELLADAMALLKSWGINSVEEWRTLGVDGQRKYQELFAAQVEIFLSKGKAPTRDLEGIFERFGKWIVDLYKSIIGVDAENPVETVVKDRYKQAIGEDLPPLSKQVETVVKRMYGQQERVRSVKPNRAQIVAARVAQSQRATEEKTTAPFKNPRSADAYDAAQRATKVAVEQINDGKPVDVAQQVKGVEMNDVALTKAQKNFARAVQMSDDSSSMVVLQNRDRSAVASIGQMSSIAANPIYSRMSFDRSTGSGAPIVSFGSMPDVRYQGITDYVMDGSERVPVTYAVVEADSVLTSNTWDGRAVEAYGEDSSRVHAVAGNGRMAGLTEAYNRGTAGQYIEDMIADTQMTGIDPQAIKELKRPALVRFIPNEKVTTGFIDRSNQSQVLEMSGKERAVQDAGKLSARRLQEYTFDENGDPTRDTLNRFVTDIGEPSALGSLIDSAGNPTEAAKTRVKAALFYAAYRDPELTSLVAVETDKQGIKRILNAMAAFAPHVINIRESSGGVIDLGPGIVEAVNMIKRGDVPGQADIFGDVNPVAQQIFEIFSANKNSAAEIGRILGGFSDSITQSLGEGSGMLLGDPLDLADAMSYLRQAQNAEIQRLIDEGKTGLSLMPDVDVESIRQSIKAGQDAAKPAENLVDAMGEKIAQDAEQKAETESDTKVEPEADVDPMSEERARAVSVAGKDADMVRLENLAAEKPDQAYVIDDNGTQMTMEEVFAEMQRVDQEAEIDAAGIGKATECILKNGGIQQ